MKYVIILLLLTVTACLGGNDNRDECHETTVVGDYDFTDVDLSGSFNKASKGITFDIYDTNAILKYLKDDTLAIEIEYLREVKQDTIIEYELSQQYAGIEDCLYSYNHVVENYKFKINQFSMVKYTVNDQVIPLDSSEIDNINYSLSYYRDVFRDYQLIDIHFLKSVDGHEVVGFESVLGKFYRDGYTAEDMPGDFRQ